jgi:hypothetical protein
MSDDRRHDHGVLAADHDHTEHEDAVRALPGDPDLRQLRTQAKELRRAVQRGVPADVARVARHHPDGARIAASPDALRRLTLRDAQVTIARAYGFEGWHALLQNVGRARLEERDMHRWFGVEFNNEVWDLLEGGVGPDSPDPDRTLVLYGAYASARHWLEVGTPANVARSEHLVARAALAVGEHHLALRHARRCLALVEAHPEAMADWDAPFAHEALARALAATGDPDGGAAHRAEAVRRTAAVADPQDREVLTAQLRTGPWFGVDGS